MKKYTIVFILLLCFTSKAQQTGEDNLGAWYMYFGSNRIAEKFSIHTEAQFRYYEATSNFNQLLLRTGLNYDFDQKTMITLGYAFIDTDPTFTDLTLADGPFVENDVKEHRIFQQLIMKGKLGRLKVEHRYRLEQRFIETSLASDTQHRARYRLQLTYPLSAKWFLNWYDEVFINLQAPIFGQNRLYGAVGYQFNEDLSLQFGYLKNHFTNSNFDRLQFAVFWNTDLRKKTVSK
ncbi:DUF2490 domain-containing protein [Ascidiimonas sp. W6]|uniref:DUF2490 domain-containing protein n=1 Tax=Ascidiimonas meishanensis TaxID=3128903 RepID=UPI0030ED8939